MVAKRRLDFSKVSDAPLSKKLKRMERQIYRNRPEMKSVTVTLNGTVANNAFSLAQPCRIASGTTLAARIGDKIRVYRIEARGSVDNRLDCYIIQKKTSADPTANSFGPREGAYIVDSENTNRFTEWVHYRNGNLLGNGPCKFSKKFKGGIVVKYNNDTSTGVVDNEIVVGVLNRSGSGRDVDISVRLWYTDA